MSGYGTVETVAGGPGEPGPAGQDVTRRPSRVLALGALVLLLAGGTVGYVLGARSGSVTPPAPGVVVPELVRGTTVPTEGNLTAVAHVGEDAAEYDYTLRGVPAIVPGGTRVGTPECSGQGGVAQELELAVVHAQATSGGVARDVVVWYRCVGVASGP